MFAQSKRKMPQIGAFYLYGDMVLTGYSIE